MPISNNPSVEIQHEKEKEKGIKNEIYYIHCNALQTSYPLNTDPLATQLLPSQPPQLLILP